LPDPGRVGITRERRNKLSISLSGPAMKRDLRGLVIPLGLIGLAEIGARVSHLQSDSLAPPSDIIVAWFEALGDGSLLTTTAQTLACAMTGLGLGFGIGLVLGLLIGLFRPLDRLLEVIIETIRPIPSVALIPIALLIYGFGYRMEIVIIAFATLWPALILTRAAVSDIEPRLLEVSQALQLSLTARIFKIAIPAALPRIFLALRLAVGFSLIVAVTVEISSNTIGVGSRMMQASQALQPEIMLAYLAWIGVLGWALSAMMSVAQRRLFGAAANLEDR
jgi:NitT/TauT family transport system permease protein